MNKYLEALYRLDDGEHTIEDFELLKKLAKDKDEQESRKDKLVVGSEWVCVISHKVFGTNRITFNPKGRTVIITSIIEDLLSYKYQDDKGNDDIEEHFLLCFKPKEKSDG